MTTSLIIILIFCAVIALKCVHLAHVIYTEQLQHRLSMGKKKQHLNQLLYSESRFEAETTLIQNNLSNKLDIIKDKTLSLRMIALSLYR